MKEGMEEKTRKTIVQGEGDITRGQRRARVYCTDLGSCTRSPVSLHASRSDPNPLVLYACARTQGPVYLCLVIMIILTKYYNNRWHMEKKPK